MIDFQEGFVSPQQAARRSAECTRICLESLLLDPAYVQLQQRKQKSKARCQTTLALSFFFLVVVGGCVHYVSVVRYIKLFYAQNEVLVNSKICFKSLFRSCI